MTKRDRVRHALWRRPVDRLPTQIGYTGRMGEKIAAHYKIALAELPAWLDNHLLRLEVSNARKTSDDGKTAFDWWGAGWSTETEGYWHSVAPLQGELNADRYPWPDPHDPHLLDDARAAVESNGGALFTLPNLGMCLFERAWSLRGFDTLLLDLMDQPERVDALLERIAEIQIELAKRFVALGVDAGYFGDDYGAQRGMLLSPTLWRRMFKPRLAAMFAVFRDAGLPVILHSDGDIRAILPDLVDIGLTALNPVQPEVLNHQWLQREFGRHLAFAGGISTQEVLPRGREPEIREATLACARDLAPDGTGLILGPSHRMQSDIPVDAVEAMMRALEAASTTEVQP